jgi:hypothetical protein
VSTKRLAFYFLVNVCLPTAWGHVAECFTPGVTRMLSTSLTTVSPILLNAHDLQTRILNIRYVLKQPNITEVQRGRFLHLLGAAETELAGNL